MNMLLRPRHMPFLNSVIHIVFLCAHKKMIGVYTFTIVTFVTDTCTVMARKFRNWPVMKFIANSMSCFYLLVSNIQNSISLRSDSRLPFPAFIERFALNAFPKSLCNKLFSRHGTSGNSLAFTGAIRGRELSIHLHFEWITANCALLGNSLLERNAEALRRAVRRISFSSLKISTARCAFKRLHTCQCNHLIAGMEVI